MKKTFAAIAAVAMLALGLTSMPTAAFADQPTTLQDLTVQLTTPAGDSLALAGVDIELVGHSKHSPLDLTVATDASGLATFSQIPARPGLVLTAHGTAGYLTVSRRLGGDDHHHDGGTIPTAVSLALPIGATISGNVTASGAGALGGATVAALGRNGKVIGYATTDDSGNYTISGLRSGGYRVEFNSRAIDALTPAATSYAWSYWQGVTERHQATKVFVTQQDAVNPATTATGIDGQVAAGFSLTGSVTIPGLDPHAKVIIRAAHQGESFTIQLDDSDTGFTTFLNRGVYFIGVVGPYDATLGHARIYWYTGEPIATASLGHHRLSKHSVSAKNLGKNLAGTHGHGKQHGHGPAKHGQGAQPVYFSGTETQSITITVP